MIEAGIIAAAILASAAGVTWQVHNLIADLAGRALTYQHQRQTALEEQVRTLTGLFDDRLGAIVDQLRDQHHADLITGLAAALTSEMDSIRVHMDDQDRKWFDLSARVENGTGHKRLRIP